MKKLKINYQGKSWITTQFQYNFPHYHWYNFNSKSYDTSFILILKQ